MPLYSFLIALKPFVRGVKALWGTKVHTRILTHCGQFRDASLPTMRVVGLGEESGKHGENMQPHKGWRWESNLQPP